MIYDSLPEKGYHDAYEVKAAPVRYNNIDTFLGAYFLSQPIWIRIISIGLFSYSKLEKIIEPLEFKKGKTIGTWIVVTRNNEEVVFSKSIGLLTFHFSLSLDARKNIIIASTVIQLKNVFSKIYFFFIRFLHKKFVRLTLENAVHKSGVRSQESE